MVQKQRIPSKDVECRLLGWVQQYHDAARDSRAQFKFAPSLDRLSQSHEIYTLYGYRHLPLAGELR